MDNQITVVDSLMGSGKTSWAIQYINENPDENILYIAPYLEEAERIGKSAKREFKYPKNKGEGKLGNIRDLLTAQEDIASTHALFMMFDDGCKEAVRQGEYTLFLDETINAVEPYNLAHKDDIDYLLEKGSIKIDRDGFIEWTDSDKDTRFNPIKVLAQNHSLFYVNQKLLMWRYPPEIFKLFWKVYILTYLFPASILNYYFKFCDIKFETKSIRSDDGKYELCEYFKPDRSVYREKIKIYKGSDLNDSFEQKPSALSASWFKNKDNGWKIKKLKNNTYNFFTNKTDAKSENIMWTTFKDYEHKLKGKGYAKKFVSCNCRATNDYSAARYLAYCLNVYPNVGVTQFFYKNKIDIDQDLYALSEMIQWIWRSNIRTGGSITVYVPSKRMRKLFEDWLKNKSE